MTGLSGRHLFYLAPLMVLMSSGCGTRTAFRTAMTPIRGMGDAVGITSDRGREARLEPYRYRESCDAYGDCESRDYRYFEPVVGR